jgi:hypothetical protein
MKYLKVGNVVFARSPSALVETLFKPIDGQTASGLFRARKNGVLFMRADGTPCGFLVANPGQAKFWVSAFKTNEGKTRYMFSTSKETERFLGLTDLGYREQLDEAARVWAALAKAQGEGGGE